MRADIRYNNVIDGEDFARAQAAADRAASLTADEIDPEQFFCVQHYDRYSDEDHAVWATLVETRLKTLDQQASSVYLNGVRALGLDKDRVPKVEYVNSRLAQLTGWQSRGVPGFLPAKAFFACLAQRKFPTTVVIRPREKLDYLPEPDIFHDVFGHVPLHCDPVFAEFLQTYGKAALMCEDPYHIERLGRLFWFTVEFGLIRERGEIKLYGSGIISSIGESFHALESADVDRRPFDMERVCSTPFEIDHYQPVLYVLESFEQLRDAMNEYAEAVLGSEAMAGV